APCCRRREQSAPNESLFRDCTGWSRPGARSEERRADPHEGCPFLDRCLEILTHPHGERIEAEAARIQGLLERPEPGEPLALPGGVGFLGRDAHEATEPQARERSDGGREGGRFRRRHTPFGLLT